MESFLSKNFKNHLATLSDEDFNKNKAAVIKRKEEKEKTLNQETSRIWQEISTHRYGFNRAELEVKELHTITLPMLIKFFESFILHGGSRRALSIQVYGSEHSATPSESLSSSQIISDTSPPTPLSSQKEPELSKAESSTTPSSIEEDSEQVIQIVDAIRFKRSSTLLPCYI